MKSRILGFVLVLALLIALPVQTSYADTTLDGKLNKLISTRSEHWANEVMNKLIDKGILIFNDENADYDTAIKKSEFAELLCLALDIEINYLVKPNIKDYYDDIDPDAPYLYYVSNLVIADVFKAGGSFNPDSNLSREEMVYYFMQAYKYKMGDEYKVIKLEDVSFNDAKEIKAEYSGKISEAQHYKFVIGNGDNKFNPKNKASRAEVATLTLRLSDYLSSINNKLEIKSEVVYNDKSIEMKIIIKNISEESVFIHFNSGQRYDFQLLDENKNVLWTWSANKMFTQALNTLEIKAGDTVVFTEIVPEEEYLDFKDKIEYFRGYITGTESSINQKGYETNVDR